MNNYEKIKNIIGVRMKEARARLGYSQDKLSEESGISRTYIIQLEGGKSNKPSVWVMLSLAEALDQDIYFFLT